MRDICDSSSSEGGEERRAQMKKKAKRQTPEMAIEFEDADTPQIMDKASSSASSETQTVSEKVPKNENAQKSERAQYPTTVSTGGKVKHPGKCLNG